MKQYYDNGLYAVNQDHPYFDSIPMGSEFYIANEFSIEGESSVAVIYIGYHGLYKDFAPQMKVVATMEDGIVYFEPIISMPACSSESLEYADSFEYLADLYMEAAKIATYLIKNPLETEYYYDDEE
jgi:hypothetical protein